MQRWTGCCFALECTAGGGKLQQYGQIFKNIIQKTGNIINYELKLCQIKYKAAPNPFMLLFTLNVSKLSNASRSNVE